LDTQAESAGSDGSNVDKTAIATNKIGSTTEHGSNEEISEIMTEKVTTTNSKIGSTTKNAATSTRSTKKTTPAAKGKIGITNQEETIYGVAAPETLRSRRNKNEFSGLPTK
jgi:hypothetical protein